MDPHMDRPLDWPSFRLQRECDDKSFSILSSTKANNGYLSLTSTAAPMIMFACLHFPIFFPLKELIIFNPLWRYTRTRTCTIIFLFFPPEILPSYQNRGTCLMQYLMYILLSLHLWLFGPFPCDGRSRKKEHLPSFDCRFQFTTTFWYYIWDGFLQHWWHVKVGCGVCVGAKNILSLKDRLNFTAMKRLQKLPRKGYLSLISSLFLFVMDLYTQLFC